jgi:hypothetical protein
MQLILKILLFIASYCISNAWCQPAFVKVTSSKPQSHHTYWFTRKVGCKVGCITGDCDNGNFCPTYEEQRKTFIKIGIENAFYIKDGALWLRDSYKKYFIGNRTDAKQFYLLEDANDRLIVSIHPQPAMLGSQKNDTTAATKTIICKAISRKGLEKPGDYEIEKLPAKFPTHFETKLQLAPYCNNMICNLWSFYDVHNSLDKYVNATSFPMLPLLLDTLSAPSPDLFAYEKEIEIPVGYYRIQAFGQEVVNKLIADINEPEFQIIQATFYIHGNITQDSMRGIQQARMLGNGFLSKLRSHSAATTAQMQVEAMDGWELFKDKVVLSNWYRLADSTREAVALELIEDDFMLDQMSGFFDKFYTATLKLRIKFDPSRMSEHQYWIARMERAVSERKYTDALMFQKALIVMLDAGKIKPEQLVSDKIQSTPHTLTLLNNQSAFLTDLQERVSQFKKMYEVDPNNPLIKYNLLACELNAVRMLPQDDVFNEMAKHIYLYSRINASSIPDICYEILRARYYPLLTDNMKEKKLETHDKVKYLYAKIPPAEVMVLADDYAKINRFDIATQVLFDRYKEVQLSDSLLNIQFIVRLLFYGKQSGFDFTDAYYELLIDKLYRINPSFLANLFEQHELSYTLLNNKSIRRRYVKARNLQGN